MSFDKKDNGTTIDVEKIGSVDRHYVATDFDDFNDKLDVERYGQTKRKLSSRHVSLMIIGQSIGTGLFIGLSSPLMTSGSLSLFIGFLFWAILVIWPLMQAVGEMCSYLPIKGSFLHYCARWVDPALGFACTLIYLYTSLMFVCLEAVAFASVIEYWTDINQGVFITIAILSYFFFNVFGVNWYGEIEFFSSMLKVLLIVGLMIFALISMCGGNPHNNAYGFQHWKEGGLFRSYLVPGTTGQFLGWWSVLIYAAFSCGGPDLLGLIAGEVSLPRKNIGLAAKRAYIRIYLFYFGGIFFMNTLCSSINPELAAAKEAGAAGAAASPWVIGIKSVGVHGLDSLVNACIMSSAWSCGNGFFYGATRTAYSASLAGYLPRFFSKCLKNGAPIYCVIASFLVSTLAYLSVSNSSATVFNWFINLSTTGLLCTYLSMWWCYFKFRRALPAQGIDIKSESYTYYRAAWFVHPYMTYFACFVNALVLFFNGFWIFFPGQFSVANLFTSYFAPVLFICLFLFWKIVKKTHFRTDAEADITTGKQEIDEEEEIEKQYIADHPRKDGLIFKIWYKVADFCFN
ncbi:proline-specific permease [Scheffersomyces xylosifermentans]|uniref:proline-specific permease n=1 Tax=Scheffersomyces xylosifermentans TaxID=1304137 RepID=UPI00315D1AE5